VVRSKAGVFLVPNAVPGDDIRFAERARRRGSRRGVVLEVLTPSPLRVAPACTVAAECGGCAMQYVDEVAQADIKSDWVYTSFRPWITAETHWWPIESGESVRRRRARWWHSEDDGALGFRARTSHRVVPHDTCPLVLPEMDHLRRALQGRLPGAVRSVQITVLHDGMHVVLEAASGGVPSVSIPPGHADAQYWLRTPSGTRPLGRVRSLHDCLPAGDTAVMLQIGPDDFVQGEQKGNDLLVQLVQQWAGSPRLVVDLYAGAGNLSLPLACATGSRVVGAEVRQQSVARAHANAGRLGVDAAFHVADLAGPCDLSAFAGADVLILDPPRKGASRICRAMGILLPKAIIMLSCDVAAGGRDAAILHAQGYQLRELRAVDLFPFAGHVEAVSLWVQR